MSLYILDTVSQVGWVTGLSLPTNLFYLNIEIIMHLISRKALCEFWKLHSDSKSSLIHWANAMEKNNFNSFAQLKQAMPTADLVDDLIVFNIGGNKYRLIASIHFNRGKVYVRHLLTHRDYDKGTWKL